MGQSTSTSISNHLERRESARVPQNETTRLPSQISASMYDIDAQVEEFGKLVIKVGTVCKTCGSDYLTQQVLADPQNTKNLILRVTNEYAKDIFKFMVTFITKRNPWQIKVKKLWGKRLGKEDLRVSVVLDTIRESERLFRKYVTDVIDHNLYTSPASSGAKPTEILTAEHWSNAISTLQVLVTMLDNFTDYNIESIMSTPTTGRKNRLS